MLIHTYTRRRGDFNVGRVLVLNKPPARRCVDGDGGGDGGGTMYELEHEVGYQASEHRWWCIP
jgi:hypothetical protein